MNERSHIHLLAALIYVQNNMSGRKMAMRDCLGVAEFAYVDAEHTDAQVQAELDAEEKAAKPPAPITDHIQ
jgi:hypothetical protein